VYILAQPPIIAKIAMNQGHATRVRLEGTHARLAGDSRATRSRWSQSPDGLRIYGLRCRFAFNCPSSWPFDMCSYCERVFPDVSRIRTMVDAYRYVCPHKSGWWQYLVVAAVDDGLIWLAHSILC